MALITCKDCKNTFSSDAKRCPYCGAKKPLSTAELIIGAIIFGFFFYAWHATSEDKPEDAKQKAQQEAAPVFDSSKKSAQPAGALGCHLVPSAILCMSLENAASAYTVYGFDIERMNQSYNIALLGRSACFVLPHHGQGFDQVKVEEGIRVKIATPDGWVEAVTIYMPSLHQGRIVAGNYLEGKCKKRVEPRDPAAEKKEKMDRLMLSPCGWTKGGDC